MGRSGYVEDMENGWELIRWRGAVASAIRGKRGQAFLLELIKGLDAMPKKMLIKDDLVNGKGEACAIGVVGKMRGLDMGTVDQEDPAAVASLFGISRALTAEIEYVNDEEWWGDETDEKRFQRVRDWVLSNIKKETPIELPSTRKG